ncbi:MAG: hypothetical protein KGH98_01890 [Candidatus Micrarchaeota archaeon]|nr:hypothetical protein [Candidatus Micrarchaeota archaeon]
MSGNKNKSHGQQSVMGAGSVVHEKSMLVYDTVSFRFADIQNVAKFEDQAKFIIKGYHHDRPREVNESERTSAYAKVFKFEIGGKEVNLDATQILEILHIVNWEKYKKEERGTGAY